MGRSAITRLADRIFDRTYSLRHSLTDIVSDRGVVSFSFDDFPASALHIGGAILENAGWRGTYYACGDMLGTASPSGTIATLEELRECQERGHELANHTLTHCNCIETDARKIKAEIIENDAMLKSATQNFAFPFGAAKIREQRLVNTLVKTARSVQHGINAKGSDRLNLLANPIYTSSGLDALYDHINHAVENRGWLIFYTHDVTDNPSPFGCTPTDLKAVVAAVQASGMDVLTVEEARHQFQLSAD